MRLKDAKKELQALGLTLTKRDGEYRVNFQDGLEATAYYTNDLDDAVATGRIMVKEDERVESKFVVTIEVDSDAFQDGNLGIELARILRGVANQVEGALDTTLADGGLRDRNGNRVGTFGFVRKAIGG